MSSAQAHYNHSEAADGDDVSLVAVTLAMGALLTLIIILFNTFGKQFLQKEEASVIPDPDGPNGHVVSGDEVKEPPTKDKKNLKKQTQKKEKPKQDSFAHPLLQTNLKGQNGEIVAMDLSPNGKYLATCSDDRTVFIWLTKQFETKEKRSVRATVELDHGTKIKFSPDSKAFVISLAYDNNVRIFRLGKKDDGSLGNVTSSLENDFKNASPEGKGDIISIDVASTGKFILTVHNDVHLILWDLKGKVITTLNTNQMLNAFGAISPCGRYVASCGFTPDVKVWEVQWTKTGDFVGVQRAFELTGHSAGVLHFSFSSDSTKMASVSKDGSWKLWNIGVEWQKGQDPKCLRTGSAHLHPSNPSKTICALAPDARSLAIAAGSDLTLYQSSSGVEEVRIKDVHSSISGLLVDQSNRFIVTAGDRIARVFHNIAGYKGTMAENRDKIINNRGQRSKLIEERLQKEIDEAEERLKVVEALMEVVEG